jgi:small-conductance mechanosensitive channel
LLEESSIPLVIITIALTFLIAYSIDRFLSRAFKPIIQRNPSLATLLVFFRRVFLLIVILIGLFTGISWAYPEAGNWIASLLLTAGFISIVIGLAAQSSLSNVISGLLIALSQSLRIGDLIKFRGEYGYVEDITLTRVIIRTWDNKRLIVPTASLDTEVITNYSYGDPSMLLYVDTSISYESDLEKALSIMEDVARSHPEFLPRSDLPKALVMEHGESGIGIRLITAAKDERTAWNMHRDLLKEIKRRFDEEGIEIPYPKRSLVISREDREFIRKLVEGGSTFK